MNLNEGPMKKVALLTLAILMAAAAVLLARYAEADDAPGGVVIAGAIMVGALVVGAKALYRGGTSRSQP